MTEKRFNCHVKFSKLPNGFMVLDYTKKGKEQTVIEDISREKAHSVMDRLNELQEENMKLELKYKELKISLLNNQLAYDDLEKENEQLKQQIKDMKIRFKRKYNHEFDEIVDELW